MLQLQDRVDWLAHELRRDVRTARRRVDEACGRLAEVLAAGSPAPSRRRGPGWYVADFHAVALLDRADPMTIERREIVSDRDGLDEITLGFSLRDTGSPTELGLRVLYGGQLAEPEAASGSRMRVAAPAAPAAAAGRAARVLGDDHAAADAGRCSSTTRTRRRPGATGSTCGCGSTRSARRSGSGGSPTRSTATWTSG